jgi:hypothetical protein
MIIASSPHRIGPLFLVARLVALAAIRLPAIPVTVPPRMGENYTPGTPSVGVGPGVGMGSPGGAPV